MYKIALPNGQIIKVNKKRDPVLARTDRAYGYLAKRFIAEKAKRMGAYFREKNVKIEISSMKTKAK